MQYCLIAAHPQTCLSADFACGKTFIWNGVAGACRAARPCHASGRPVPEIESSGPLDAWELAAQGRLSIVAAPESLPDPDARALPGVEAVTGLPAEAIDK